MSQKFFMRFTSNRDSVREVPKFYILHNNRFPNTVLSSGKIVKIFR